MAFALFLSFEDSAAQGLKISAEDRARVREIVSRTPGLVSCAMFTPEVAEDLFNHDGVSPPFALQLHFDALEALEAAAAADGVLQGLFAPGALDSLKGAKTSQQAFLVREFPVDDPQITVGEGELPCSYVVHYPGPAQDISAWLSHYIAGHPRIMRKFPGIRWIEILSRVDWCTALPLPRAEHIQRNRIVFDSAAALEAALKSPVRFEMREDYHTFPAYEGGNFHYPMATETVVPSAT